MYTSVCGGGVCCASLCCPCASPSMQMTSACSYSVPSIYVAFSPAGSMNGRQSCKWSVNNKLIKTHNRHQRRRTEEKNIEEKRSVGVSRGRKCQKALVTDQIKADYLNNLWYVGRAKPNRVIFSCIWASTSGSRLIWYTTATQIHKIVLILVPQMQMKLAVMVASDLLPLYF